MAARDAYRDKLLARMEQGPLGADEVASLIERSYSTANQTLEWLVHRGEARRLRGMLPGRGKATRPAWSLAHPTARQLRRELAALLADGISFADAAWMLDRPDTELAALLEVQP